MTFPTEQDRLFFTSEEAKRIQELWEPRMGDLVCDPEDGNRIGILAHPLNGLAIKWQIYWRYAKRLLFGYIETLIFLPRQGQLQEMLEEKGYGLYHLGDERFHPDFDGKDWNPEEPYRALAQGKEPGDYVKGTGPTPAIALGRALIEVIKEGVV